MVCLVKAEMDQRDRTTVRQWWRCLVTGEQEESGRAGAPGEIGRRERAEEVRGSETRLVVRSIWPKRARR
jgi:hypothetical protein